MTLRASGNSTNPLGLVMAGITLTWMLSTLLVRMFSRQRELAADETAAILLGTPFSLIQALESCDEVNRRYLGTHKLHSSRPGSWAPDLRSVQAAQFIGFTWTGMSQWSFLSSHPATKERIVSLRRYWN